MPNSLATFDKGELNSLIITITVIFIKSEDCASAISASLINFKNIQALSADEKTGRTQVQQ
jgi:hypothetical protein